MDPNEALRRLRELAELAVDGDPATLPDYHAALTLATELAETILGLDEWLKKGGASPDAWQGRR